MDFSVEDESVDHETHVIEVAGAVELYTAPELKERLTAVLDGGKTRLVIDLSNATFVDSTTLGVLVAASKRLRAEGGSMALVLTEPTIEKTFLITGLDRVFSIHGTREEALAVVSATADASDSP